MSHPLDSVLDPQELFAARVGSMDPEAAQRAMGGPQGVYPAVHEDGEIRPTSRLCLHRTFYYRGLGVSGKVIARVLFSVSKDEVVRIWNEKAKERGDVFAFEPYHC